MSVRNIPATWSWVYHSNWNNDPVIVLLDIGDGGIGAILCPRDEVEDLKDAPDDYGFEAADEIIAQIEPEEDIEAFIEGVCEEESDASCDVLWALVDLLGEHGAVSAICDDPSAVFLNTRTVGTSRRELADYGREIMEMYVDGAVPPELDQFVGYEALAERWLEDDPAAWFYGDRWYIFDRDVLGC